MSEENKSKKPDIKISYSEKKPLFFFAKKQSGVELTRAQIKEIKQGRKKLRRDMRAEGVKDRKEFELTASSMGLYFDSNGKWAHLLWFLSGKGWLILLGVALFTMLALFALSWITTMRGHFTINMSNDLFREGFTLSETADFKSPTTYLVCTPLEHVPCKSINDIPEDVDDYDGMHSSTYFAYTYYIRNEGESTVDYKWELVLNSESQNMSSAVWVMVFEDGEMVFYAKERADGTPEALPPEGDNNRGYLKPPLYEQAKYPEDQYEIVDQRETITFWRVIPRGFLSDSVVTQGIRADMAPQEVHKYTVVMWLEGDDPDCNNDLVGGHLGLEMYMSMLEEAEPDDNSTGWKESWHDFWSGIFD